MSTKIHAAIESVIFKRRLLEEEIRELSELRDGIPLNVAYREKLQGKVFALLPHVAEMFVDDDRIEVDNWYLNLTGEEGIFSSAYYFINTHTGVNARIGNKIDLGVGVVSSKINYRAGQIDRDLERKMRDFYFKHPFHDGSFLRLQPKSL